MWQNGRLARESVNILEILGLTPGLDSNLGFDGICNKALQVGRVIELLDLLRRGDFWPAISDLRIQVHNGYPVFATLTLCHLADRFVVITVDLESLFSGQINKG